MKTKTKQKISMIYYRSKTSSILACELMILKMTSKSARPLPRELATKCTHSRNQPCLLEGQLLRCHCRKLTIVWGGSRPWFNQRHQRQLPSVPHIVTVLLFKIKPTRRQPVPCPLTQLPSVPFSTVKYIFKKLAAHLFKGEGITAKYTLIHRIEILLTKV